VSCAISAGTSTLSSAAISSCAGKRVPGQLRFRRYAFARATCRQLSMAPVGHGEMHALQALQIEGSTT
jgi:hypothetical protein